MVGDEQLRARSESELLAMALDTRETEASREAASELLSRHMQQVYAWCYRYVRDHERAKDLGQEVMISAYRSLASFAGRAPFTSWLFAIARNRCLTEIRKPALLLDEDGDPDRWSGSGPNPEEQLMERLDEEAILGIIRECLTDQEQDVLWLRCYEEMPMDEITMVLRIDQASGARGVLQTARRKLRPALVRRGILTRESTDG